MILVTGASGFVGQHLVRHLSGQGKTVRALYRNTVPDKELISLPGVSWMKCDLLDVFDVESAMDGVEEVFHCAAIVSFHPKKKEEMLHANVESTANVVNEALVQNVRKLAYVSSVAALGRTVASKKISEEEEWEESRYNSAYGLSKYYAEMEVWRGMSEGLNAVIVNPGIILGEGDWSDGSSRLMKLAADEFPFYTEGINGWVDVKDVVNALYNLMYSDIDSERFILSAGNFSYKEIFSIMAEVLNKKPPRIKASAFMTGVLWRWNMLKTAFTGATVTITKESARNAQKQCWYDNGKLLTFLPDFAYTPIHKTLQRMAAAYISTEKM
ncbi:NAD-dependent epimerase/dehydratase family protein [Taibaiella soli]|uniref:3-beta hydroxysteroid dehydrogenase n=1 Tax=Taibaiella soli TaxID=1649169 RepID=A0A2W2ACP1_9BACT|nr:NAD-dependent epimerase/dehydratase family protein [Taibaiella soli]PZF73061.1 3-beta hydroxysteroid dehydrogenase [Taibaiella soli]